MIEIIGINEKYVVRKEDIKYMRSFEEQYLICIRCCSIELEISKEEYCRLRDILQELKENN